MEGSPRDDIGGPELVRLMSLSEEEFESRYGGTPIARAKRRGFLRNVAVALGNWADVAALPALILGLNDKDPMIRGHAAWGLGQLGGEDAVRALKRALETEGDAKVRGEIEGALQRAATREAS